MAKQADKLENMKVDELRENAKDAGVTGTSHMRKEELVEALGRDGGTRHVGGGSNDDVLEILKRDHEKVKALFKEALAKEDGDDGIEVLAKQIIAELKLHTEVEEKIFYPALKEKAVSEDEDEAKDEVLEAYVEHDSVKELIAKIEASSPSNESYKAMVQVMSEQVDHHVEEEENEMFKQAKELLGQDKLDEIGRQILQMKQSAGAPAA